MLYEEPPFFGYSALYDFNLESTHFHWTHEHEILFQSIKNRISEDTILVVPPTDYLLHNHLDSSDVETNCILIQQFPEGKQLISFNSKVFDKAQQKKSTFHRELCGIVSVSQTYELYLMGSLFLYTYIGIANQSVICVICGDARDNYHISF